MSKNSGLKNEEQVQKILVSGSLVLKEENSAGVLQFTEADLTDGIISGPLVRPKYDEEELKKSIDISISELVPPTVVALPDMVLRSIYNEATQSVINLTLQVETLNSEILTLNSKISELNITTQSLKVQMDAERLKATISENQMMKANEQIASTNIDLQNAMQNSINEAVQRVSLTARNEALQLQVDALQEQLFGQQGEIVEGALVTEDFSVKILSVGVPEVEGLLYYARANANNGKGWLNGPKIEIENFSPNDITITTTISDVILNDGQNKEVSASDLLNSLPTFNLASGNKITATFTFKGDKDKLNDLDPNFLGSDQKYTSTITMESSSGNSIEVPITFRKQQGDKWTGG